MKISSDMTFFYKKGFPAIWLGFNGLAAVALATQIVTGTTESSALTLLWPLSLAVIGLCLFSAVAFDLVDEVSDEGEHLVVRRGLRSVRVSLSEIMDVTEAPYFRNPTRVTLTLAHPGGLGRRITFVPVDGLSMNPFSRSQIAADLARRAATARAN